MFFLPVNFKIKQTSLTRSVYSDRKPGCLTSPVCSFPEAPTGALGTPPREEAPSQRLPAGPGRGTELPAGLGRQRIAGAQKAAHPELERNAGVPRSLPGRPAGSWYSSLSGPPNDRRKTSPPRSSRSRCKPNKCGCEGPGRLTQDGEVSLRDRWAQRRRSGWLPDPDKDIPRRRRPPCPPRGPGAP